jgi:3-methyl-2-oxobutanoate hydroxymethyltransferase
MREAAGGCFVQVGLIYGDHSTYEDYLRAAHAALKLGGDCAYCAASLDTITKLAAEGIPVVGHVGLIPAKNTWTGGFKAVGRTADTAMMVYRQVKERVATEIAKRTSLVLLSMGAGTGCDAQYLFAEDVLGYTRGHRPRHAKVYRNFRTELDRLQLERIAAFKEFIADVESGAYPEGKHKVAISDAEFKAFSRRLRE